MISGENGGLGNKRVGIITYDVPHLKTEQVVRGLLRRGVSDLEFFALPFKPRAARPVLIAHRPEQFDAVSTAELARAHGLKFTQWSGGSDLGDCDYYLITGAGILSPEAVRGRKIINAHPGIIPSARGLDAFKWSIYNGVQVGVTLHFIDEEVDRGDIIVIEKTPVYETDSLTSFARRHYELEIEMMIDIDSFLSGPAWQASETYPDLKATMRMPSDIEAAMIERFDAYKEQYKL